MKKMCLNCGDLPNGLKNREKYNNYYPKHLMLRSCFNEENFHAFLIGFEDNNLKIKLLYKFFTAFSITSLLMVGLLIGVIRFVVFQNFTDYLNRVEMEKLDDLVHALADEYREKQNWEEFEKNHRKWPDLLRNYLPGNGKKDFRPPPPPRHRDHDFDEFSPGPGPRPRPPRGAPGGPITHRLSLFDAQKKVITGNPYHDDQVFKKIILNGKTIGWLGLKKKENLTNPLDIDFLKQQGNVIILTGLFILVLAGCVSFFLSKHLLKPVNQLTKGTKALRAFKFDTKIKIQTRDELGQLAQDFNKMAQTLGKYEKMRQQWITDISHELRTPLSILRGEIEAVQDGIRSMNKDTVNSLHSEVLRLSRLVDDLHVLSQADSQNLHFKDEIIYPVLILENTVNSFNTKFNQQDIAIQADLPGKNKIKSKGDKDRLVQLFSNLLENTLRYTDSPGTLKIFYICSENMLTINFEDSYPGVPDRDLDRIFDRLFRVDKSRSRAVGGSGLGLSICRQIARAHNGGIRAEHSPSGGLIVVVNLPVTR